MRDLHRIRKHLSTDIAVSLANALVSSRLDYCNSLLYSISRSDLKKLQRIQNTLARIVTKTNRFTSSAPLLNKLHWLPVRSRILFKLNLLIFKSIKFNNPPSLRSLFQIQSSSSGLRSADSLSLKTKFVAKGPGSRAFSYYAPFIWNTLPSKIRNSTSTHTFRRQLKTYYFKYPP